MGGLEDKKFLLLPEDGDHDVVIFGADVPDGSWVNVSEEETHHNLSALPQTFLGRNPEMQQIVDNLVRKKRRLMTLLAAWAWARARWPSPRPRTCASATRSMACTWWT